MLLAEELNARGLSAITRDERVRAFEQLHLPVAASLSHATVIKVGQLVGASEVIAGSFRLKGDELTVEAHGIRMDVGRLQPQVSEHAPLKDFFAIYSASRSAWRWGPRASGRRRRHRRPGRSRATSRASSPRARQRRPPSSRRRSRNSRHSIRRVSRSGTCATSRATTPRRSPPSSRWLRRRRSLPARNCAPASLSSNRRTIAGAAATLTRLVDPKVLQTTTPPPAHLAPVFNNLGIVQLRRGASADAGSATYFLTRATDADPETADYQFNLGYAYLLDRNHKAALYWLREAVRREVTDADAHYLLALALQAEGSGVEAAREKDLARQLVVTLRGGRARRAIRTCRPDSNGSAPISILRRPCARRRRSPTRRSAGSGSSQRFISIAAGSCSSRSRTGRRCSSSSVRSISHRTKRPRTC